MQYFDHIVTGIFDQSQGVSTPDAHSMRIGRAFNAHWTRIQCALDAHSMCIGRAFNVHWTRIRSMRSGMRIEHVHTCFQTLRARRLVNCVAT